MTLTKKCPLLADRQSIKTDVLTQWKILTFSVQIRSWIWDEHTAGQPACMRAKLLQSGHTVHIRPDIRLFACTHTWNSHRQLCLELQKTVSSYISYRPCDLTELCNHSPMTKMLSLEGMTLIYFSPDKINVTQCQLDTADALWKVQARLQTTGWEAPFASHVSRRKLRLYRLPTTLDVSNLRILSVARCTHMQTNMRLHKGTQNMKPNHCGCEM